MVAMLVVAGCGVFVADFRDVDLHSPVGYPGSGHLLAFRNADRRFARVFE